MRASFWRIAALTALVAALTAALSGCVVTPPATPPDASTAAPPTAGGRQPGAGEPYLAERAAFKAVLTAADAVPPAHSAAQGLLVAMLDRNTGLFRWKLTFQNLSGPVSGASFHGPAASGQVAEPVLPVGGRVIKSPYEGRAMLSGEQIDALLAGRWYVNLRTERYPKGELRGQLVEMR